MIGLLTPSAKDPQARSDHGIAANGGYNMDSDTAALPELVKEKKRKQKCNKGKALETQTKQRNKKKKKKDQTVLPAAMVESPRRVTR